MGFVQASRLAALVAVILPILAHLLFRRVKANDVLFGRQGWQRQRLADLVLSGQV